MNKLLSAFTMKRFLDIRTVATRLTAEGKEIPKKKVFENRITLINTDNTVSITELKNAQSLSQRRDLKLVKIQDVDAKTRRPVYKLMTNTEYHSEELEKRKERQLNKQNSLIKGEKLLTMSSKIEEHDLITNVNKMIKLLNKQYEVRVIVTGEGQEASKKTEHIYSTIEKNIKASGNVVQKRLKGNSLRFQLLPLKSNKSQTDDNKSETEENKSETEENKSTNTSSTKDSLNSNNSSKDRGPL